MTWTTSQKPHLLIASQWELRFQHVNLQGDKHLEQMLCSSVWVLSWEEPAWLGAVLAFSGRVFGAERSLDLLFFSCSVADIPRLKGWPVWNKEPHLTNRYADKRYSSSWLGRAICDQEDTFLQQLGANWLPGRSSGSNHVRHQPWWVSLDKEWPWLSCVTSRVFCFLPCLFCFGEEGESGMGICSH